MRKIQRAQELFIALNTIDIVTTIVLLRWGIPEGNPIWAAVLGSGTFTHLVMFALGKTAAAVLGLYVMQKLNAQLIKIACAFLGLVVVRQVIITAMVAVT